VDGGERMARTGADRVRMVASGAALLNSWHYQNYNNYLVSTPKESRMLTRGLLQAYSM